MMKSLPEEINTGKTVLAAEMYYLYDMSQKEIADRLNVSRPWVSKLLKRARETGLVRIEINSPLVGSPEIEQRLREKYRIRNITVIRLPAGWLPIYRKRIPSASAGVCLLPI